MAPLARSGSLSAWLPSTNWTVVDDLTIGRKGANLGHLVTGPPGVFVCNTKNLTGELTVHEHAILQNRHRTASVQSTCSVRSLSTGRFAGRGIPPT